MKSDFNHSNLELYLKDYYKTIYPYDLIAKWLSYPKEDDSLSKREFAFIMRGDEHMRYLSFNNADEFKDKLQKIVPHKVDIGAIYNRPPRDRKKIGDFFPVSRELVFDIDLTDYDPIRNCCKETNVCGKCWRWITIAVKVLERLLRNHFGFRHLLWVFSGRRGVHCWIADYKARHLSNRAREAIAKYLTFDKKSPAINKYRVHPMADNAYRTIMDCGEFDKLVVEQGWLDSREEWRNVLKLCPDPEMGEQLDNEFEKLPSPELRWDSFKGRFGELKNRSDSLPQSQPSEAAKNFLRIFVLEYAYPKIDEKVTTGLNHLLKAPFTVHPKTGIVAVPISPELIGKVKLDELPRVDAISACAQIMDGDKENPKQTGNVGNLLSPYIQLFEKFVKGISEDG